MTKVKLQLLQLIISELGVLKSSIRRSPVVPINSNKGYLYDANNTGEAIQSLQTSLNMFKLAVVLETLL